MSLTATTSRFCEGFTQIPSSALKEWEACRKESWGKGVFPAVPQVLLCLKSGLAPLTGPLCSVRRRQSCALLCPSMVAQSLQFTSPGGTGVAMVENPSVPVSPLTCCVPVIGFWASSEWGSLLDTGPRALPFPESARNSCSICKH